MMDPCLYQNLEAKKWAQSIAFSMERTLREQKDHLILPNTLQNILFSRIRISV